LVLTIIISQGTLPFISHRILVGWEYDPSSFVHTAIDDLESFMWVLLWAALHKAPSKSKMEQDWIDTLSGHDVGAIINLKSSIMGKSETSSKADRQKFSKPLQSMWSLLLVWGGIARAGEAKVYQILQDDEDDRDETEQGTSTKTHDPLEISQETDRSLMAASLHCYKQYLSAAVQFRHSLS
jgi:Fungal protein kinase